MMLLALLSPLAATANARFVCTRKMAQAGPSCPRCHEHDARTAGQPSRTPCCRVVIDPAPVATAAMSQTSAASPASFAALVPVAMPVEVSQAATTTVEFPPRAGPRFQASSTILRL
jgi:hypothetical protein